MARVSTKSNEVSTVVETPSHTPISNDNDLLSKVIKQNEELVKRLEKIENAEGQRTPKQEKYDGPRSYSFSRYGKQIVTDFLSFRADVTKGLTYKNQYGEQVINHMLELTFSDNTKKSIPVDEYLLHKKQSDQYFPKAVTSPKKSADGTVEPFYVFEIDGETIEVAQKAIN